MSAINIKRIVFRGLSSPTLTYTAMGGIRFYDQNGALISGTFVSTSGYSQCTFNNFSVNASSQYNGIEYSIRWAFDTSVSQTQVNPNGYWLVSGENQSITVDFNNAVNIKRIEYNPQPDTMTNDNRGIEGDWYIDVYDDTMTLVRTYNMNTPYTAPRNTVQALNTFGLLGNLKYLVDDGGVLKKLDTTTTSVVPSMTSATAPSPFVVSASSFLTSYDPYKAFDGTTSTTSNAWVTNTNNVTGWLQIKLDTAKKVRKYKIMNRISATVTRAPKNWTLKASNTGSFTGEEVILDTKTNQTGWLSGEIREFYITNTNTYQYYRLDITANNGDTAGIHMQEFQLFETAEPWTVVGSSPATESDFLTNGFSQSILKDAPQSYWNMLTSLKIIRYSDIANSSDSIQATVVPKGRIVYPQGDINMSDIDNIDSVTFTINEAGAGKVRTIASFDSGATWKTWDGTQFINITPTIANVSTSGMTKAMLTAIPASVWTSSIVNNGTYSGSNKVRFAYYIEKQVMSDTANIDNLAMQVDLKGVWRKAQHITDYDYYYTNSKLVVELYKTGSFKVTKAN